ncbi:DUF2971 domain-containing protein [Enterobacter cloacae]
MGSEVIIPKKLSDSGFSLDTHVFRYRRDSDINKNIDGVEVAVSSIIDEVEGASIWHSAVGALNDPFEIYARVNVNELAQMTESQKINIWAKLVAKSGQDGILALSHDELYKYYKQDEFRLKTTFSGMNENNEAFQKIILEVRQSVGIACFTSVCDSRLMWGYYCNGFSGVCLIYNRERLLENKVELEDVKYHEGAFEINIIDSMYNLTRDQQIGLFSQIARTKHAEWAHEFESRSLIDLHEQEKGKGHLMRLEKQCIEGVIIGQGVRKDVKEKIEKIGNALKLQIFSADVDYQIFGVRIS